MIVQANAQLPEKSCEGACRDDVGIAWFGEAGGVTVVEDHSRAGISQQPGHDMRQIDCQRIVIASEVESVDQTPIGVIDVERAKLTLSMMRRDSGRATVQFPYGNGVKGVGQGHDGKLNRDGLAWHCISVRFRAAIAAA